MTEEIQPGTTWRKSIPQQRDQLQSRLLVGIVGTLLVMFSVKTARLALSGINSFPAFVLEGIGASLTFAVAVWLLKAATPAAAGLGGLICLLLTFWTGYYSGSIVRTALTPLILLFALTFICTRIGRERKTKAGLAGGKKGRSASQVIANLSTAALCATPLLYELIERCLAFCGVSRVPNVWLYRNALMICLAALVEATGDTVSSEIGQVFGGTPRMLLNWQRVEPGTDGAVTTFGTFAGVVAGMLVAASGAWAMHLHLREAILAGVAGICGLFFDSLLGATVERKGWLGNDLVNFTSTAFAAVAAAVLDWYLP